MAGNPSYTWCVEHPKARTHPNFTSRVLPFLLQVAYKAGVRYPCNRSLSLRLAKPNGPIVWQSEQSRYVPLALLIRKPSRHP